MATKKEKLENKEEMHARIAKEALEEKVGQPFKKAKGK